jgi:hypothetical protein
MATTRLTIKREGDKFTITSSDDHIKQVFFGWADGGENAALYGRSTSNGRQRLFHDEWQWTLDDRLVKKMFDNLASDDSGESHDERKANDVVRRVLSDAMGSDTDSLDEFTTAYLVAALWSTTDHNDEDGGQPLDANYGICDIAPEAMRSAMESCAEFQEQHKELLATAYELYTPRDGYHGPALAGHDLWLTAAGHGAGYWDRGLGDVGKALTDAARKFGECYIEVGDDGLIYGF